jgi:peroxiredoxin
LTDYRGNKHVVLVVVKGMPTQPSPDFVGVFCPGCVAQINAVANNYDEFKKRNAEIVAIFPGPPEPNKRFLKEALVTDADGNSKLPFPLVSDPAPDLKAVRALEIRGDWARPSTYILNKSGDVVFAYVGSRTSVYDRPPIKALLDQLDKLNGSP